MTVKPCVIVSFESSDTHVLIEIVLNHQTERFFDLPTFVQTPACDYEQTWSFTVTWDLSDDASFATLYDASD